MSTVLLVVFGYLCGSIPTGVWFARSAGVDVRRAGSGNIGATNVARTAGALAGLLTLICDVAKGFLPTLLADAVVADRWQAVAVGIAAVVGHVFPIFARFAGGKGVATAFGVFLHLAPGAAAVSAVVFALVAVLTRYVSLASMLAAAALPAVCAAIHHPPPIWLGAVLVGALVIARHRDNIRRLRAGSEPAFRLPGR